MHLACFYIQASLITHLSLNLGNYFESPRHKNVYSGFRKSGYNLQDTQTNTAEIAIHSVNSFKHHSNII